MSELWNEQYRPRLAGATMVLTGATSGIGRAAARRLAELGAQVVLAVRDVTRGAEAAAEITAAGGRAEVSRLDLADLASVREFAGRWGERPLDVLINNAGVSPARRAETADGFELALGTNFLGPFALTNLLLPRVRHRVVIVASGAHRAGRIDLADPHFRRRRFSIPAAYGQSKLADMLWGLELERRLQQVGSTVEVVLAHPGWALTDLQRATGHRVLDELVTLACRPFAHSSEMGALPTLVAATAELPAGSYLGPDGYRELRGFPTQVGRDERARDLGVAGDLWRLAEAETRTSFPL